MKVNKEQLKLMLPAYIVSFVLFLTIMVVGKIVFKDEFIFLFRWWCTLFATGLIFMPIMQLMLSGFSDKGWIVSKAVGIALGGWLMWFLASVKLLKFKFISCLVVMLIWLAVSIAVYIFVLRKDKASNIREAWGINMFFSHSNILSIIFAEILFTGLFFIWMYMKGFNPTAYGSTEKLMDFGFMQSMMKSEYMPPEDLWLSGHSLNYYYVGQFLATFMTKLSGVTVGYGYNFMLMTIAALAFSLPCSICINAAKLKVSYMNDEPSFFKKAFPYFVGALAGVAVTIAGNMHYIIYAKILPSLRDLLGITQMAEALDYHFPGYWFPDATRYIGYNPDTADKTIHEFPSYSFILGDLHAHVINIIFVLSVCAVLLGFLISRKNAMDHARLEGVAANRLKPVKRILGIDNFLLQIFSPHVILIGMFIGIFHTTNYWDFPIYFVVAGAIILFSNAVVYNFSLKTVILTVAHAEVVLVLSYLICLPFTLSFNQISTQLRISHNHTPLYQLMVLWGLPILCVITFLIINIKEFNASDKIRKGLYGLINSLKIPDLFILTIGLCAIGLIIIPELVYVKDIYSGDYKRANTMFKLTYQAYILFGMSMAYIISELVFFSKRTGRRVYGIILCVLLIGTTGYFGNAASVWFNGMSDYANFKGLDSDGYLYELNEQDFYAANWINENIEGRPVMLEVNGLSYSYHNRMSVNTGLPTLLGWQTHEWLWQSDGSTDFPPIISERSADIEEIYTSEDIELVRSLISKYNIKYIYVGELEMNEYDNPVNHDLLLSLGKVVYPENFDLHENYGDSYILEIE